MRRIGIIGGGAWGTALAIVAREAGHSVILWAREQEVVETINSRHENEKFLAGIALDAMIRATENAAEAADADLVLFAVPAQFLRGVARDTAAAWRSGTAAVICSKGIEHGTCALMSEVIAECLPDVPVAVLSGPSFAAEVARDQPTAVTLACADPAFRVAVPAALGTTLFRIYSHDDGIGAQVGGAVKNVLAIACGIVAGRRLGSNARAALITRGLAEMARLAVAKGARPDTLMGLSGLGDLVLTCTTMKSRNYSLGVAIGEGRTLKEVLASRRSVAEGVFSAASVGTLARRLWVDMPICFAVDAVLNHGADIDATVADLLARPPTEERPAGQPLAPLSDQEPGAV
jgi:glycerol-3-phosphate dehydrogenase (NAD(P)+)